nr:immunoglobulin heavy chain junction region [Macaca mulatta]
CTRRYEYSYYLYHFDYW